MTTIRLHQNDLPDDIVFAVDSIAIDTEAMGLLPIRDRLCLVQLTDGQGDVHLVQFTDHNHYKQAVNLKALLAAPQIEKIFHFARFDVAVLMHYLDVQVETIFCTKIASKLARTYTQRHGLKDLCKELLGVDISKEEQSSDWGAPILSEAQKNYAAQDVVYLHKLRAMLHELLIRTHRGEMAAACFKFLPTRAALDLLGWRDDYVLQH